MVRNKAGLIAVIIIVVICFMPHAERAYCLVGEITYKMSHGNELIVPEELGRRLIENEGAIRSGCTDEQKVWFNQDSEKALGEILKVNGIEMKKGEAFELNLNNDRWTLSREVVR